VNANEWDRSGGWGGVTRGDNAKKVPFFKSILAEKTYFPNH
jgi:hypothetical protein